jgi:hypothetical protein
MRVGTTMVAVGTDLRSPTAMHGIAWPASGPLTERSLGGDRARRLRLRERRPDDAIALERIDVPALELAEDLAGVLAEERPRALDAHGRA